MRIVDSTFRVRYAETDQMGIVYYANYLIWMEVGRVEFCRAAGLNYSQLEAREGILLAVVEANCRYASPARYDEEITVSTSVPQAKPRLMRFDYVIRANGRLVAEGYTKHIFLNRDLRPVKMPEKYLDLLTR